MCEYYRKYMLHCTAELMNSSILHFLLIFLPAPSFWWSRQPHSPCRPPNLLHHHTGLGGVVYKIKRVKYRIVSLQLFTSHTTTHHCNLAIRKSDLTQISAISWKRWFQQCSVIHCSQFSDCALWHYSVLPPLEQGCQEHPDCVTAVRISFPGLP